jgi:CheY-like chemotaxis protein/HPt (histidine-containing phosphotransfer) domain-containing protein
MNSFNLDELKVEYLAGIDEEITELEEKIIGLEKVSEANLKTAVYEIFRVVHSIKGSAGSFEFYMLANIFHRFEDYIDYTNLNIKLAETVDLFLKFVDLSKKCIRDYQEKPDDLEKYATLVDEIAYSKNNSKGKVLLVEPAKSIQKMFKKICTESNLEMAVIRNGATAMNRILTEKFDAIVTSLNTDVLDGKSLLCAIRVMKNINAKTPLLLVTSDENTVIEDKTISCIQKDNDFIQNIEKFIKEDVLKSSSNLSHIAGELKEFPFNDVFCVEDDRMIQMVIKNTFDKETQANLTMSSDLVSIQKVLLVKKPDLIILDYFLKDCTAEEIVAFISLNKELKKIPIVFMTSSPEKIDMEQMKEMANIKGIVEKPLKSRTLLQEIALAATG